MHLIMRLQFLSSWECRVPLDKTCLPGRMKAWCYQHGLLPRLLWPLQMYEIAISRVEWIQQYSNKYLRKWLGIPPCFSKVRLYTSSGNLQLPISSLVEEFKIGKVRLHMMMKDSADEIIRKAYPEIKSGTKLSAVKSAQEAECSLRIKDIIGVTQTNRAGLGSTSKKVSFKMDPKGKRDMVSEEVRMFEEEQRKASAVTQAKQCAWTKWNDIEPIRLSWKSLIAMEPLAISFLLRSTYDLLPNATNLQLWEYTNLDLCLSCKSDRGTLRHVLSACPHSLQMYTWRHNKVLEVIIELLRAQYETANQQSITAKEPIIQFLKEGECPVRKQKNPNMKLLNGASDWKVSADLKTSLQFPVHIIQTEKRPDIVAWSDSKKCVLLIELTVPWEENREESTRAEEKPLRDTACRLHGKGLDMPCDSYWGWLSWFYRTLSHFVSFKNRNHWPQFESCLESSSDHGAICIKLDLVESEKVFSMKVIHAEPPFPCDYVRNGYCKRVITSTAESKRVF